jgi:hypothetical protein
MHYIAFISHLLRLYYLFKRNGCYRVKSKKVNFRVIKFCSLSVCMNKRRFMAKKKKKYYYKPPISNSKHGNKNKKKILKRGNLRKWAFFIIGISNYFLCREFVF